MRCDAGASNEKFGFTPVFRKLDRVASNENVLSYSCKCTKNMNSV